MKKVLIITYYWPPAGGGGVQRISKFCKYLSKYGWEPHIITLSHGHYQAIDNTLINDIKGLKVYYTNGDLQNNDSKSEIVVFDQAQAVRKSASTFKNFIRINFFLPDTKILWYWPALKKAKEVISKEKIDLIFSTSPPYTVQLIAKKLKKITGLKWVVDFRDPWVENIYYNNVYRMSLPKYINRKMEKSVLENADKVITVGDKLKHMLERKCEHYVTVIHNGYDDLDFPQIKTKSTKFIIGYYGSLNSKQISSGFFELLKSFVNTDPELYKDLEVHLAGIQTNDSIRSIKRFIPDDKLVNFGYLSHNELLKELCREQLLLQLIHEQKDNEVIIGSKIYEYFHSGNPILCLGNKQCEAAQLIKESDYGITLHYEELDEIKKYIQQVYRSWKMGELNSEKIHIPKYERQYQAKQLSSLLNETLRGE